MSLIDNISHSLGLGSASPHEFRMMMLGDWGAYFEGVTSLKDYSGDKVEILVKGGVIILKGQGLKISKYCAGDLAVRGKIISWERV